MAWLNSERDGAVAKASVNSAKILSLSLNPKPGDLSMGRLSPDESQGEDRTL